MTRKDGPVSGAPPPTDRPYDQTVNVNNGLEALVRSYPLYFISIFLVARFGAGLDGFLALGVAFVMSLTAAAIIGVLLRRKRHSIMLCGGALSVLLASLPPTFVKEFHVSFEIGGVPITVGWSDVNIWINLAIGFTACALLLFLAKLAFDYEQGVAARLRLNRWSEADPKPNRAKKLDDDAIGGDAP